MGDLDGALKWYEQGARCASGRIEEAQQALRDVESALKGAARLLNGKIEPMR